jgi:hypothetical protein
MVIKPYSVRDSRGKMYIYVQTNILEMVGYQADGTHSELYKIAAGRHIQFELGDQAEKNTNTECVVWYWHKSNCRLITQRL